MSYADLKRQRERELIASLHPGFPVGLSEESDGPPDFDGGPRGEPEPLPLPWPLSQLPPGWGLDPED